MKLLLIIIPFLIMGCSNKDKNLDLIPRELYISTFIYDDTLKIRQFDYELNATNSKFLWIKYYYSYKYDSILNSQILQNNSNEKCILIAIRYFNNANTFKCFYVLWNAEPPYKYKYIPDTSEVTTNLPKEYFSKLYPDHIGKYNYKKYDTIKAVQTLSNEFTPDMISKVKFIEK